MAPDRDTDAPGTGRALAGVGGGEQTPAELHQRIREARPELVGGDVVVGLLEVAEGLDGRGGHDAAPSTRLQRATSPASSANSRNCPGAPTTW